eukprot:TRINITY_DN6392_c0_g4_i1.p2 TRINITY_DN6392_c0_g4~~TRINITY_DN6392_c0_g4_i1.p2  ORF type:complete len:120 (+),score=7.95 TRINITY_DN6392_c0_g4_i1:989-1348(+)
MDGGTLPNHINSRICLLCALFVDLKFHASAHGRTTIGIKAMIVNAIDDFSIGSLESCNHVKKKSGRQNGKPLSRVFNCYTTEGEKSSLIVKGSGHLGLIFSRSKDKGLKKKHSQSCMSD